MVGGKGMQILCRGQGGGDRESVMPGWEGGAYKPGPDTSDSEGVEEASAADGATLVEEKVEEADSQTYRAWFLCSGHGEEEKNGEKIFGDVSLLEGCMSEW